MKQSIDRAQQMAVILTLAVFALAGVARGDVVTYNNGRSSRA